jgi:hypothetical protein
MMVVQNAAPDNADDSRHWEAQGEAENLPESGGTIGPLPGGTVIEVERVSGYALIQRIPSGHPARTHRNDWTPALAVDAYNAAQA